MNQEPSRRFKGTVCGVGYLGRFHAQKIKAHKQCELIGVFDSRAEQAIHIGQELGVRAFENLNDIAKNSDFVVIAASTMAHYELCHFFLEKKIPVLVEKPIAATADLGNKLSELAELNKTPFTVGHIERFNPSYDVLRENKKNIKFLELNRCAPFKLRGSDVSVLHDLMVHDFDLLDELFGLSPDSVSNFKIFSSKMITNTIDEISLRLELNNGVQISINCSRISPVMIRNFRAQLGDRVVYMNTATQEGDILHPNLNSVEKMRIEKIVIQKVDALQLELDHFISVLNGEAQVKITGHKATEILRQIEFFSQQSSR